MTREQLKWCFEQWFDELRNYISYRCGDPDLATDIVQETYVKLWEKDMEFRDGQTRSLLYKMANELWISQYRKKDSERKYKMQFKAKEEHNEIEEQLYFKELKESYESQLALMAEGQRTVFLMSRMDQLSYREIAERLDISVKAVEKRMNLALKALRKIIDHER